jgi:hypothetical protein
MYDDRFLSTYLLTNQELVICTFCAALQSSIILMIKILPLFLNRTLLLEIGLKNKNILHTVHRILAMWAATPAGPLARGKGGRGGGEGGRELTARRSCSVGEGP